MVTRLCALIFCALTPNEQYVKIMFCLLSEGILCGFFYVLIKKNSKLSDVLCSTTALEECCLVSLRTVLYCI